MAHGYDKDVREHLYENRIIYLSGEIATPSAEAVVSRLLVLDSLDHQAEIKLYISSFGGSVYAGLAIYDAIQMIEAPVSTFCMGAAFSMAAWLLAAGEPGRRYASVNSRIMIHQVSTGLTGTSSDIKVAAENMLKLEEKMREILAYHTKRPNQELARMIERDRWMTPEEAKEFGLIDEIVPHCERKIPSRPKAPNGTSIVSALSCVK